MSLRVLLMEDDHNLRRLYAKALEKAHCTVDRAATVSEARQWLTATEYDIFIVDMLMGEERGIDLLRERYTALRERGTEIVVVSAEEQFNGEAAAIGVQHFLAKPVLPSSLAHIVEEIGSARQSHRIHTHYSLCEQVQRVNSNSRFSKRVPVLARWSHAIEQAILDQKLHADIYVGFQQLHRLLPMLPRYQQIARVARSVTVFAQPTTTLPTTANLHVAELTLYHRLASEWFIVVNHPQYARALVAHETTPVGTPQAERMFEGVLTDDAVVVAYLEQGIASALWRAA